MLNDVEKHAALVRRLKKSPEDIVHDNLFDDRTIDMLHAALGIAGEAGEVVDMIKKHVINGNTPDDFRIKLGLEIGDIMFYIQMLCMAQGLNLGEVLRANIQKLERRYPNGYSDQASIAREDLADKYVDAAEEYRGWGGQG